MLLSAPMTLRNRLVLALMLAAVLPMAVLVGVPLVRAERRVRAEAESRLDLARRQAAFLVDRERRAVVERLVRAAWELSRDERAVSPLLVGPEDAAHAVVRASADRGRFDVLEILREDGTVLAASHPEPGGVRRSAYAELPDETVAVVRLPAAGDDDQVRVALGGRHRLVVGSETLLLVAAVALGDELVRDVAAITGQPAALVDGEGRPHAVAGNGDVLAARITGSVPLGNDGWRIEVAAPAGDVARLRRELLGAFAGIAPFALLSALVVGVFVAARIAQPITTLAERADDISIRHEAFARFDRASDEVERLRLSFDRMLESLARSEDRRVAAERIAAWQEVARRIAHEVKNPLSPIKLAALNIRRTREKAPHELDRAIEEETATILEEVESLRGLVDEFSQFARLPAAQPVPCDPRDIVRGAVGLFRARIAALGVRASVDLEQAPERIVADPEQLGRVLKNVVANALDALEPVADRTLRVSVARADGGCVITVRDSGVGLGPEALRRIFEPYYTTRGERGGSGLGMAIAYRIVAEHGGTIEAQGTPGAGATITIRLPAGVP